MYGLYGLKHHKVEKSLDVTIVTDNGRNLKIELEFCEAEFAIWNTSTNLSFELDPNNEEYTAAVVKAKLLITKLVATGCELIWPTGHTESTTLELTRCHFF